MTLAIAIGASPGVAMAAEPRESGLSAQATAGDGLRIGAGLGLAWRFGDRCTRDGDLVECSPGPLFATLQLDTRYRVGQLSFALLAMGGRGLGGEPVSVGEDEAPPSISRWAWRTTTEVRWHPRIARSADLWIAAEAGLAGEILSRSDAESDAADLAFVAGGGLGVGVPLTGATTFTIESRLLVADLEPVELAMPRTPLWLTLSAGLSFGT